MGGYYVNETLTKLQTWSHLRSLTCSDGHSFNYPLSFLFCYLEFLYIFPYLSPQDYGVLLDDVGHTLRGLFIIDDKGVLRQITMNDLPVGRSVDETLRLVQAFQYTDKHGEVCPAGWKPGADTIVPDPKEKLSYFQKQKVGPPAREL